MSHLERRSRRRPQVRVIGLTAAAAAAVAVVIPSTQADAVATRREMVSAAPVQGWSDVVRQPISIKMDGGWSSKGELDYPRGAQGRLPVVVLLHGSGHSDMDQTLPGSKGSTFVPIAQTIAHQGYAVVRFNKRGVTGLGPVLSRDKKLLAPKRPYQQIKRDAAAVVRFAAQLPNVDPSRILILGHSEGTQVASNLAAHPAANGIPRPAGLIAMGVVGVEVRSLLTYQIFGAKLARLHEEFDVDGNGTLTAREAADGLIGQPKAVAGVYRKVLLSGSKVNPTWDRNSDGKLAIDAEVGPAFRKLTGIDRYPNVPGVDQATRNYLVDIARFPTVRGDLPRFRGPSLMLNGENDIQTPARAAIVAHAAVRAARNTDASLITYPGLAHTMNRTSKFAAAYGPPDAAVLRDIARWLVRHR